MAGEIIRPEQFEIGVQTELADDQAIVLADALNWSTVTIIEETGPGTLELSSIKGEYDKGVIAIEAEFEIADRPDTTRQMASMAETINTVKTQGDAPIAVGGRLGTVGMYRNNRSKGILPFGRIGAILVNRVDASSSFR